MVFHGYLSWMMFTGGSHFSHPTSNASWTFLGQYTGKPGKHGCSEPNICGLWQDDLPEIQHQKWEQHGKHVSFTSMIQIPMEYRHLMIFLKKLLLTTFHNAIPSISPSYFPSMYPIIIPWYTHIPSMWLLRYTMIYSTYPQYMALSENRAHQNSVINQQFPFKWLLRGIHPSFKQASCSRLYTHLYTILPVYRIINLSKWWSK